MEKNFIERSKEKNIECEFLGRLPYPKTVQYLSNCDVAVNPISKGASQSIINKVGDYAAAGLPVINTQECKEYKDLVYNYEIGYNVDNGNIQEIADKIEYLYNNQEIIDKMGKNNRKLAQEKFDRTSTYPLIIELFKQLLGENE